MSRKVVEMSADGLDVGQSGATVDADFGVSNKYFSESLDDWLGQIDLDWTAIHKNSVLSGMSGMTVNHS